MIFKYFILKGIVLPVIDPYIPSGSIQMVNIGNRMVTEGNVMALFGTSTHIQLQSVVPKHHSAGH